MPLRHVSSSLHRAVQDADWRRQWSGRGRAWRTLSKLGLTGLHAAPIHRKWLDVARVTMDVPDLPQAWSGRRVVQISDLHVSPVVWRGYMREQLRHVASLRPDLLVVTGDLITGGYRYAEMAAALLGETDPMPPMGVIAILGNHDYGTTGARNRREGDRRGEHLAGVLRRQGVRLLRNESMNVQGLTLVGLDDLASGRLDAAAAFRSVSGPTICLNHDPRNAEELLGHRWDWMLSGHTHGRQLAETKIGKRLNGHRRRQFVRGLYELEQGRRLYVNRGLSYGQRWQWWCKPEITVFKLTPGSR